MGIRPSNLILVKGTEWISHAIEDVEKSPYSHVAIVVYCLRENIFYKILSTTYAKIIGN